MREESYSERWANYLEKRCKGYPKMIKSWISIAISIFLFIVSIYSNEFYYSSYGIMFIFIATMMFERVGFIRLIKNKNVSNH